MSDYLNYAFLAVSFLLVTTGFILYRKILVWKIILFLVLSAGLGIVFLMPSNIGFGTFLIPTDVYLEYYTYILFVGTLVFAITLKRKVKITQNLTDYDYFELEKELDEINKTSELLRLRYVNTIGLVKEGVIFYDADLEGLFMTDQAAKLLDARKNQFTVEEYAALIHPDDAGHYLNAIKKPNVKAGGFELKYRVKHDTQYVWVEEKAKIFEHDKLIEIISTIQGIDVKFFPETMIHEIDSLPNEQHLMQYLAASMKEPEVFHLVMIHLTNVPDINKRFGRDVGNLMIAEYIKKIRFHFAKDINSIFRITGIQFALVIKEQRKYDVLQRALQSGGDLVNLTISIGGIQQVVYPNLGIIKHEPWSTYTLNEYISFANKALDEAIRNTKRNYAIFGE